MEKGNMNILYSTSSLGVSSLRWQGLALGPFAHHASSLSYDLLSILPAFIALPSILKSD